MRLLIFTVTQLKGKIRNSWLLINIGILMYTVGDTFFSYATLQGAYWEVPAHPLELFYYGDLLLLLAFYTHMKEF